MSGRLAAKAALAHLIAARDLLKAADCPKTLERVRLAISSAKGAVRNAECKEVRQPRRRPARDPSEDDPVQIRDEIRMGYRPAPDPAALAASLNRLFPEPFDPDSNISCKGGSAP